MRCEWKSLCSFSRNPSLLSVYLARGFSIPLQRIKFLESDWCMKYTKYARALRFSRNLGLDIWRVVVEGRCMLGNRLPKPGLKGFTSGIS